MLQLVREVAAVMQEFTQSGGVRPFGVSLLLAGFDGEGPQLFQIDPSGSYFGWKASAIGKNFVNCKTFLEKRYSEEMETEDAIHTALLTMKEGFEGEVSGRVGVVVEAHLTLAGGVAAAQMKGENIEVAIVDKTGKFRLLSASEVNDYLEEME